jgi:Xaa-Pro aminopeptidase
MSKGAFSARLGRLRKRLADEKLEGVVVVPGPNLRYFTGVDSILLERPFMMLVPADGEAHMVAPALEAGPYTGGAVQLAVHPWTDSQGYGGAVREAAKGVRLRGAWGVEGKAPFLFLAKLMEAASPKFVDAEPVLQGLREVKDEGEVELLRRSARVLSRSFEMFPDFIKEGKTELEVARKATQAIYDSGATKVDDILVQSGPRAADPHGLPTSKKIRRGEGVIVDVGTTFEGYYADITRTFGVGTVGELEKVYSKVLEAEERGIEAAGEGEEVGKVDGAARGVLKRAGMGEYFIHRTGHGLGLEVHEAPYIVEGGKELLRENMCFTVEPGVYVRGKLGVRIEDDVLVLGRKGRVMTGTPKEFGWWR